MQRYRQGDQESERWRGDVGVGHPKPLGKVVQDQPEDHEIGRFQHSGSDPVFLFEQMDVGNGQMQAEQNKGAQTNYGKGRPETDFGACLGDEFENRNRQHDARREAHAGGDTLMISPYSDGQNDAGCRREDGQKGQGDYRKIGVRCQRHRKPASPILAILPPASY